MADARALDYALVLLDMLGLIAIALHVLTMNVTLDLILAEPQLQV